MRVLLASMPFGALGRPALGVSQLKAELARRDVACAVHYFTFAFAETIGFADYEWVQCELPYTAFAGDWCFTEALYGRRPDEDEAYLDEVFAGLWRQDAASVRRLLHVRGHVESFIEECLDAMAWREYDVIGFTSTFEQNLASLALARRVRTLAPDSALVFGGANWEGAMGLALMRQFSFVDYACSGEAEHGFPALLDRLGAARPRGGGRARGPRGKIPGVMHRRRGTPESGGPTRIVTDMDALAVPDFSDYFTQLDASTVAADVLPTLLFETSRGCWWGAKSHCTFCGLNGHSMAFRSKSAPRALAELDLLVGRWRTNHVDVVDNILDMHYFHDLLPAIADSDRTLHLFYETKANLSRAQVELLARAGVDRIQPGIESLSDHVLSLMGKGTTALRNVQLLKWCREQRISVDWNLLYGFPGETECDYQAQLELLESIGFLEPPGACGPVRLDRFSPYFDDPERHGLLALRPIAPYRHLYPFDAESVAEIACYFDFDYAPEVDPRGIADPVIRYVEAWRHAPPGGELRGVSDASGTLTLVDTREPDGRLTFALEGLEREAYTFCDQVRTLRAVVRHLEQHDATVEAPGVRAFLDSMVANRLMVCQEDRFLSLALDVPWHDGGEATAPRSLRTAEVLT